MIGVYIHPEGLSLEQYQEIDKKILDTGVNPKGLLMHSAFLEGDSLAIFDVWESQEDFQEFGRQLAAAGAPEMSPMFVEMVTYRTGS